MSGSDERKEAPAAPAAGFTVKPQLHEALQKLVLSNNPTPRQASRRLDALQRRHTFWETQPVPQFAEASAEEELEDGPIDPLITVAEVRQEPYPLPASFEWCTCDMSQDEVAEEVYNLLTLNYVEDDEAMFRFDYSKPFLAWALQSPGFFPDWHVGVRAVPTGKLVAFITGVPAHVRVRENTRSMAEINFLCIHKKLRSKRLAPLLIKEVTRRINLRDTWQAAYTAGVVLPKPIAVARYYHRTLNAKKLVDVGFTRLPPGSTMMRMVKQFKLEASGLSPGVRSMTESDVPAVTALLASYLKKYAYAPVLDEEEVRHWLLPREGVVYSYVIEGEKEGAKGAPPQRVVTDFFSFYSLPSTVINHPVHSTLRAAYCYYYAPAAGTSAATLIKDAMTQAALAGFDVFNALDVMENTPQTLGELKFGIGDGHLQFYCFNWRTRSLKPSEIGLVLL